MKTRLLGTYSLGCMNVRATANTSWGGSFTRHEDGQPMDMVIGCNDEWPSTVAVLLHEALESALMKVGCRYAQAPDIARSSGGYVFFATHEQLTQAIARAGEFAAKVLPDLSKAYKKLHPAKKSES